MLCFTRADIRLAGSAEAMAVHYGICSTFMAVLNFIGEPLVAALSDTFGRKPFLVWGRLGLCAWFLTYCRVDLYGKLWMRLAGEALCFGVIGVGHWSVFAASHSDVFGTRADLSSRIQSSTQMWTMMGVDRTAACPPLSTPRILSPRPHVFVLSGDSLGEQVRASKSC